MKILYSKLLFLSTSLLLLLAFGFAPKAYAAANGKTCATAIVVNQASLPYSSGSITTCGAGDDYGKGGGTCNTNYGAGEDYVFQLNITSVPVTYKFDFTTSVSWMILQLFNGCPSPVAAPTNCLGNVTLSSSGSTTMYYTFTAIGTYYAVVDHWPTPNCGGFSLNISTPPPCNISGTVTKDMSGGTCNVTCPSTITFRDPGGASNYPASQNVTQTFTSTSGDPLQISFSAFNTESCCDKLYVYDGPSTASPQVAGSPFSGTTVPSTITSSGGSLTFNFVSDGSVQYAGWAATIVCLAPCSGTPTPGTAVASPQVLCTGMPTTLSVTGATLASGLTYQWHSSPDGVTFTNIAGATSATYVVTPPLGVTFYRRRTLCGGSGANSASVKVTVKNVAAACYCTSNATSSSDMDITAVNFGTVANSSAYGSLTGTLGTANGTASMYSDFGKFGAAGDVMRGVANPINVQVTQGGSNYSHQVVVYIDLNRNGSLTDPGESFVIWAYANSGNINNILSSITIPAGTALGETFMRIVCVESSSVSPCGTYSWGETEDYIINIIDPIACSGTPNAGVATAVVPVGGGGTCSGGVQGPFLSVTGYDLAGGLSFQWQSATAIGGPWTNIAGATSVAYQVPTLPLAITFYRVRITCANSGLSATSVEAYFQPYTTGQDCISLNPVCAKVQTVSDPGYQSTGTTCDFTGSNNCTGGERGSAFYDIIINANGNLEFTITPNDGSTDYDFLLWGPNPNCATLDATTPIRCNYSAIGTTGLNGATNGTPTAAFMAQLPVTNGQRYILVVSNFTGSTSGFTIDYKSSPINTAPPAGGNLSWSGGNGTAWNNTANWGGCAIPDCTKDASIPVFANQPQITSAMGTVTVKDLTINAGATLTLAAGATLKICGSIYNFGRIIADPTSTILFSDNVTTHTLVGNFTGLSRLGNLTITRTAGTCTVLANNDIEMAGNFTTSNVNSVFNSNGRKITVGGNFTNASAATTFAGVNTTTSILEFNGASQNYSPGGNLTLNDVVMSQVASPFSVTLVGNNMLLGTAGVLSLNSGKIITNALKVVVNNTNPAAVTVGNTSSYVEGNLDRALAANATGSFNFPVGHATPGYELANVTFTSAAASTASVLSARFDTWGGAWPMPAAPGWSECLSVYNLPYLNNGYWTIDASTTMVGSYDLTLYNRSYSNHTAANGWSIAKSPSASPTWALNGICLATSASGPSVGVNAGPFSPLTATRRNGMKGFSKFATIQAATPLPVNLLNFTGKTVSLQNYLEWNTSTEENSDYFVLERSKDGKLFDEVSKTVARGSSNTVANYSDTDKEPFEKTYYRLRMHDKDGRVFYSSIVTLTLPALNFNVNIRPNPATDKIYVDIVASEKVQTQIEILDMIGRVVLFNKTELSSGNNSIENSLLDIAKGSYFIKVSSDKGDVLFNGKFIKQ